jgi:hypothetical protein
MDKTQAPRELWPTAADAAMSRQMERDQQELERNQRDAAAGYPSRRGNATYWSAFWGRTDYPKYEVGDVVVAHGTLTRITARGGPLTDDQHHYRGDYLDRLMLVWMPAHGFDETAINHFLTGFLDLTKVPLTLGAQ